MSIVGTPEGFINFTNGTPRADKIIATSNIGIGTNAPAYELDVVGNVHANSLHLENFFISSSRGLDHVTNENNSTGDTIISTNATTGFQTSSNIVIDGDIHVSGAIYQSGSEFINIGTLNTTDAITMPSGTTAQRPTMGVEGMLRHNTSTGYFEYYASGRWNSIVTSPGIISISPNPFAYANVTSEEIEINGSFFDEQSVVRLEGADGTTYNTTDFVFDDASTIKFKIGTVTSGQFANRPYRVLITDRLGSTTKSAETLRFGELSITSFSPNPIAYANVESEDITVYGTFFDNGSNVQLEGTDGTLYDTTNFVFDNASTIRFRIGTMAAGQDANRPYKIVVTDTANVTTKSTQTLGFPNPTWSSPASGSIQEFYTQTSNTLTLSALDSLGGSYVGYSVLSGEIPSGLTFSGNTISGTSTASDGTTNTVTIRATDTLDSSKYADLTLTFQVNGLYPFGNTHTFTTGGQTSYTGPSLTTLRNAYDVPWDTNTNFFNVTPYTGIQQWTVPKTGMYEIDAYGATGGYAWLLNTSTIEYGGRGARIRGRFNLNKGEYIRILVGQMGVNHSRSDRAGGGGGGTFVYNSTTSTLLIAAGGGGGGGQYARPTSADANHDSINGNDGTGGSSGTGGTNGNGGNNSGWSGGGAGWLSDGSDAYSSQGGHRFSSGGVGGSPYSDGVYGGFGGGGGTYLGGGGGGGYSGGGAGGWSYSGHGGGGGSYIDSSAADPFTELNPIESVHGKVIINFV